MNWPSARSSRASGPRSTTKRAPAIFAAVAKSIMPSASPSSKCCLRLEAEIARLAVLLQHHVGGFVRTVGHVGIEHVRQAFEDAADRVVQRGSALLLAFHLAAQRRRLGFQRGRVGAGTLALTHLAGQRVATRLLLLQRGQHGAPFGVLREDLRRRRCKPAPGQRGVEASGVCTDGADVVHNDPPDRRDGSVYTSTGFGSTSLAARMEIS